MCWTSEGVAANSVNGNVLAGPLLYLLYVVVMVWPCDEGCGDCGSRASYPRGGSEAIAIARAYVVAIQDWCRTLIRAYRDGSWVVRVFGRMGLVGLGCRGYRLRLCRQWCRLRLVCRGHRLRLCCLGYLRLCCQGHRLRLCRQRCRMRLCRQGFCFRLCH
jgi:hypothetical protein